MRKRILGALRLVAALGLIGHMTEHTAAAFARHGTAADGTIRRRLQKRFGYGDGIVLQNLDNLGIYHIARTGVADKNRHPVRCVCNAVSVPVGAGDG